MFRYSKSFSLPLNDDALPAPPAVLQPRTQMVKCLLSLKVPNKDAQTDEEILWEERFASALVKNMLFRCYDELLKALASRGTQPTKCVYIKRPSIDGRMQIGSRKVVPHVACFRIWRNPSVKQATQLTPCHPLTSFNGATSVLTTSKGAALMSLSETTCINPYHYQLAVPVDLICTKNTPSNFIPLAQSAYDAKETGDCNSAQGSLTSQNSVEYIQSDEEKTTSVTSDCEITPRKLSSDWSTSSTNPLLSALLVISSSSSNPPVTSSTGSSLSASSELSESATPKRTHTSSVSDSRIDSNTISSQDDSPSALSNQEILAIESSSSDRPADSVSDVSSVEASGRKSNMTITSNPAMYGGHLMQQPQSTYVHAFGNAPPHPHHAHMMSVPQPIHPGGTSAGISGGDMYSRPHYQSNPLLNHSPLGASSLEASASSSSLTGGFSSNNSCSVFYDLTSPLTPHNNQTRPSVNYGHQHEGMCRVNSSSSTTSPHSINNNAQQTTFNFVQSSSPDAEFMEYEEQQHPTFGNDTENQYSEIIALSSNPNLVQPQQQQHGGSLVLGKEELTFSHLQTSPSTQQQNHSMCPSNHSYVSQNQHAPHMNTSYNQFSSSSTCSTKPMQSSALPLSVSNQNNSLNEQLDIDNTIMLQSPRTNLRLGIPVRYAEPLFWCQIRYYEFSQQVGEVCYVSPSQFAVDGGTDPSSAERFCLGSLSNVNRQEIVEITRNNIGKGLQLFRTRNHEIHAKCLGDSPLFVQSQCCNLRYNWDPGTVCKIPPDFNLKVFTMEEFQDHLKAQLRTNQSYKSIMDLTSLCSIRISFIKGWGQEYTRKRITDVPCWIEILLNGPSQWLDRVLQRINPSSEPCDSR